MSVGDWLKHQKKQPKRKWFIWGVLIGIILIVSGLWVINQKQPQSTGKPKNIRLTAVGDSLTYGVGDPSGKGGYTHLISKKVNRQNPTVKMTTANFGVSGQTTAQIDHRVMTAKKLRASLKRADVITVTTGGNDLLQFLETKLMTQSNAQLTGQLKTYCQSYQKRVGQLLTHLRRLNPRAPIFVFGIYNPMYVYFPQVSFISRAVFQNNQMTQKVISTRSNVYFVSINQKLSDGQYQTAAARAKLKKQATDAGTDHDDPAELKKTLGQNTGEVNHYLSTKDHFHPNKTGYKIMTNLLYQKMSQVLGWLKE